jgi:hypothetical protein
LAWRSSTRSLEAFGSRCGTSTVPSEWPHRCNAAWFDGIMRSYYYIIFLSDWLLYWCLCLTIPL